ncbi:MAG TPA: hypothetical protein VFY41_02870 [Nitrososphaeraceae archaeon]|nr:hypothetical protein [Nitrososphaeraceae archaeon]
MMTSPSWSNVYPLQEKLKEVKGLSKIPIGNEQDVYNTLTDRETLNKELEQVLEDKEYQRHRDELVNLLMGLKYKIKIEDLTLYDPIFTSNTQKSKCDICQESANIHCINYRNNVWLCVTIRYSIKKKIIIISICYCLLVMYIYY